MLKTRDYDLWSMRMEQYFTHTDYALWKVIINDDSPVPEPPVCNLLSNGISFLQQEELSSLAMGTSTTSGNMSLAVGMP
nr:ribonuclease H-like domain-containing protein [Tanacetum cinerariifolium]